MAGPPSSSIASSEETRAPATEFTQNPNFSKPIETEHVSLKHFDNEGHDELSRRLSRTQSRASAFSTHTQVSPSSLSNVFRLLTIALQDPTAEDFDYEQHLRHVLRKGEREGVLRRELGVAFKDLKVGSSELSNSLSKLTAFPGAICRSLATVPVSLTGQRLVM